MADELQPAEEEAQPALPESVPEVQPDPLADIRQRLEAAESALAQHTAPDAHNALYAGLHERLATVEQALSHLAGGGLSLQLGAPELEAIGNALKGHITACIHDVLKEHFNFTPPAQRGDRSA